MFDNLVKSRKCSPSPLSPPARGGEIRLFTTSSIFIDITCFFLYILKNSIVIYIIKSIEPLQKCSLFQKFDFIRKEVLFSVIIPVFERLRPLKNVQFYSSSRKAKILTGGIY